MSKLRRGLAGAAVALVLAGPLPAAEKESGPLPEAFAFYENLASLAFISAGELYKKAGSERERQAQADYAVGILFHYWVLSRYGSLHPSPKVDRAAQTTYQTYFKEAPEPIQALFRDPIAAAKAQGAAHNGLPAGLDIQPADPELYPLLGQMFFAFLQVKPDGEGAPAAP